MALNKLNDINMSKISMLSAGQIINSNGKSSSISIIPQPLEEPVSMHGFALAQGNLRFGRGGVFDGRYVWIAPYGNTIPRIDTMTDQLEEIPIMVAGQARSYNAVQGAYENGKLWFVNATSSGLALLRVDTADLSMSLIDFPFSVSNRYFKTVLYDGEFLWVFLDNLLVRVDPVTFAMSSKSMPDYRTGREGIIHTPDALWAFSNVSGYLTRVSLPDLQMRQVVTTQHHTSGVYDGKYIWLAPYETGRLLRFDPETEQSETFDIQGDGIAIVRKGNSFRSCHFDGKYVWLVPYDSNEVVRLDTQSMEFKGYDVAQCSNIGNILQSEAKFYGSVYDGKNLWLIPGDCNRLVKFAASQGVQSLVVREKYELENGTVVKAEATKTITSGNDYVATAPVIDGYTCIGYKIDGGAQQQGTTATISPVTQNHEIIFIYKAKQQGGNDSAVPAGMVMYFTDTIAPDGWLKCDGSAVSRTDYQNLFNVIGTKFGSGDNSFTFNLPDLRAQFIRGFDDDKGVDEGRSFGSYQPGSLLMNDSDSVTNTPDIVSLDARYNPTETLSHDKVEDLSEYPNLKHYIKQPGSTRVAVVDAVEPLSGFFGVARPKNIALLACIKY